MQMQRSCASGGLFETKFMLINSFDSPSDDRCINELSEVS